MSKFLVLLSVLFAVSESSAIPTRFRRQYGWGGQPYYGAAQYYETQPQQWSSQSQYQNNQNYYSPYFYGYQRQQNWQTSNQNSYQSQYNRPSWISDNNNGYATAPPTYNQANVGGYTRPKYLATMQPKPTLSPVILERSTLFVTAEPIKPTEDGNHPTFLERLGVATLPVVPSLTSSEEESLKSAEEAVHETLGNGALLPERSSVEETTVNSEEEEGDREETTTVPETTDTIGSSTSETSVLEKDEIASSEFFASSTETSTEVATTEEVTTTSEEAFTTPTIDETTELFSTTTEIIVATETSTITAETSTVTDTSTEASTTTSTEVTTTIPTTTTLSSKPSSTKAPVKEVKPVTLLAFQEVTNEVTSNIMNVTQPTVDQSTSVGDLNEIGEGSGTTDSAATTEENTNRSTFVTGIVGLRAPPVPKTTDPEKEGLAVVEWTDSDNEVRKVLLTQ
ncbi:hypothetical protein GCK72_023842 [Caenorhabditis remanei]|uniref:Uncharacterized protein n=1 Tax=Caenorhabditis remanei TaxID=31234 RepID=A0A6A5FXJ3_CAERE|nr:hypothetical protein GCK72_023842 [Caenorhabditis remanei]KAF1747380.1 hypothetical protein GCK72_023842 [Caenorhabditis remanei]